MKARYEALLEKTESEEGLTEREARMLDRLEQLAEDDWEVPEGRRHHRRRGIPNDEHTDRLKERYEALVEKNEAEGQTDREARMLERLDQLAKNDWEIPEKPLRPHRRLSFRERP